jgi:phosphatidylserine/phosphatidylglycerophosphate/cardiolipin synthase-like enzyme
MIIGILSTNYNNQNTLNSKKIDEIQDFKDPIIYTTPKLSVQATNVCITEVYADGTGGEWFEIYNPTLVSKDLTNWKIVDQFYDHTADLSSVGTINPGEVITIGDSGAAPDYTISVTLTDSGDAILLIDNESKIQDAVLWGSVSNDTLKDTWFWNSSNTAIEPNDAGESIYRVNRTLGGELEDNNVPTDWVLSTNPTPGVLPKYKPGIPGSVLITEVMIDSADSGEGDGEYIEIYNTLDTAVDIGEYSIQYDNLGSQLALLPEGTILAPKSYLSFVDNDTYASLEYGLSGLNYTVSITLSNSGGKDLILADSSLNIIDRFAYRDGSNDFIDSVDPISWTDTGIKLGAEGKAISRLYDPTNNDSYDDTNSSADWRYNTIPNLGNHTNTVWFLSTPITSNASIIAFSSPDNSYDAITELFDKAQSNIDVCVYQFTSYYILQSLINAMDRGVKVRAILEDVYPGASVHTGDDQTAHEVVYVAEAIYNHVNGSIRWEGYAASGKYTHAKYFIVDNNTVGILTENFKATGVPKDSSAGNRGWGIAINSTDVASKYLQVYNVDWSIAELFNPGDVIAPSQNTEVLTGEYVPISTHQKYNNLINVTFQTVVGPDETINVIVDLIDSAKTSIYAEIFYIYPTWNGYPGGQNNNPFLIALKEAAIRGVDIKIILDSTFYNIDDDNDNDEAAQVLEAHGAKVRFSNNSGGIEKFHVKGFIVDEESVMISSLNWNENSATNNREIGIIVNSSTVASYYVDLFLRDWDEFSSETIPEYGEPGIIPTYTWLQWLPVLSIIYFLVLGIGYVMRRQNEKTLIKKQRLQDKAMEKKRQLTEAIPEAHEEIPIDIATARNNLNYFYGEAVKMSNVNYDGTPLDNVIPSYFIMNYIEYNHEMIEFGKPIRPIPQVLILKYKPENYIAIEGTMQLHLRLMDETMKVRISRLETNLNQKDIELSDYHNKLKVLEDKIGILESTVPLEEIRKGKKVKVSAELKRKEGMIKKLKEKMEVVKSEKMDLERDLNLLTGGEMTPLSDLINELQLKIKKQSFLIKKLEELTKEEPKYGHL